MKTFEQILLDNPPFYPDSFTDEKKMRFMFLLENGHLIGNSEGRNHSVLMGWGTEDGTPDQIGRDLCEQNRALRICFSPFSVKDDGTRGSFWSIYIEICKIIPNDVQWATLSTLYLLKGRGNTFVTWDAYSSKTQKWGHAREGTLYELRDSLNPPIRTTRKSKKPRRSEKPRQPRKLRNSKKTA